MFDFGLGTTELLLIAVVAIIVVGPKDLPRLLRTIGRTVGKIRSMAREFQGHLEEAARDTGIDDLKNEVKKAVDGTDTDLGSGDGLKQSFEDFGRDLEDSVTADEPQQTKSADKSSEQAAAATKKDPQPAKPEAADKAPAKKAAKKPATKKPAAKKSAAKKPAAKKPAAKKSVAKKRAAKAAS